MSKVLVDEEVLNFVAVALKRGELVAPNSIDQKRCTDSLRKIEDAIQESKQKNFSILKWHPVSEMPKRYRIIVRLKNGVSSIGYPYSYTYYEDEKAEGREEWDLYNYRIEDVVEWASLPV